MSNRILSVYLTLMMSTITVAFLWFINTSVYQSFTAGNYAYNQTSVGVVLALAVLVTINFLGGYLIYKMIKRTFF